MELGEKLKHLRKERRITLSEMAEKTGLSLGFLSNVERGQTSPTITHLHKMCAELGITLNDLLIEQASNEQTEKLPQGVSVVRADNRKILFEQNDGDLSYSSVTTGVTEIKGSAMTIRGADLYAFGSHDHDELGIVSEGILELKIQNRSYFLYPGDTVYIKAGTEHSGRKASEEACVSYWIKVNAV